MGLFGGSTTTTQAPDAAAKQWGDYIRGLLGSVAGGTIGAGGTGLPDYQGQIDQANQQFDRQGQMVDQQAADYATKAGAFGGSREAILRAQGMNDVNLNRNNTITNIGFQQNQDKWNRTMGLLGALPSGFGGTGSSSTTSSSPGVLGGLLGLGTTIAGIATGNPAAIAGAGKSVAGTGPSGTGWGGNADVSQQWDPSTGTWRQ